MESKEPQEELVSNTNNIGSKQSNKETSDKETSDNNLNNNINRIHEVLPKTGILYFEQENLDLAMCKPKIMPLKSNVIKKLEAMEIAATE